MRLAADVWRGGKIVATISRVDQGFRLDFLPNSGEAVVISSRLSSTGGPITSLDLHPFFLNLLPEGARLRLLLDAAGPREDSLDLLLKTGWDAIGDVTVLPHGRSQPNGEALLPFVQIEKCSFWEVFEQGISGPFDAAVAGAQEKVSSSTVAFGVKTSRIPSAILKLSPPRYPKLVQNEAFFMKMARNLGLKTAKAVLVKDRLGDFGLLVDRFDRVRRDGRIHKLRQEDGCQILNLVPSRKYEPSLRRVVEGVCEQASAPMVEVMRLLKLAAFSYLIGNCDLHAKNISLLWGQGVQLSPAYDLLSTLPYPLDRHMALQMLGKDDRLKAGDFADFGRLFGVPPDATVKMVRNLCDKSEPWVSRITEIGFDEKTASRLEEEVRVRLARLQTK